MRLTGQRFQTEDFKDQEKWISKLLSPLNKIFSDLVTIFSNNITIQDNMYQEIKEVLFINSTSNFPLRYRLKFNSIPKGLVPIYVYNKTNSEYANENPFITWDFSNGELVINEITGLTSSTQYIIRLLIIYG